MFLLGILFIIIALLMLLVWRQSFIFVNWMIDDYLPRNQHLFPLLCDVIVALLVLDLANYIHKSAVKKSTSARVIKEEATLATFLATHPDIRWKVLSYLPVRDVVRFGIVEKDWRSILEERTRAPGANKVKDWYFPLWFHKLHPDKAIDKAIRPFIADPLLPTRRNTTLKWHGVHHDNTFQTEEQSLPYLDFLWDVPGNIPPLGFIFAATSGGLLLFHKFTYLPKPCLCGRSHMEEAVSDAKMEELDDSEMEENVLLTVCNPFTKQSRDLPYPRNDHYRDHTNTIRRFYCDDMHLVVDDPTSNEYRVLTISKQFVKEWSSVSRQWTTSRLDMSSLVGFSSLYYQGCLYVPTKKDSILAVTQLKRNEWGQWVIHGDDNEHFAIIYEDGTMFTDYFGGPIIEVHSNLRLLGCNGLIYAVLVTEYRYLLREMEFHVFELPDGYNRFVRVARIPFSYVTDTVDRCPCNYQGRREEKFCCTAKEKEIWIACHGHMVCFDVVVGGWYKVENKCSNSFEDSISAMPFEPSFTAMP
ncbi:hypothetical protein M758_3G189200 [Ceratodon purpureus]|nr:hypothetical protein M758_3G189200 [Ceratodon purpureus]